MKHTPLHQLTDAGPMRTAGRLQRGATDWVLANAHAATALVWDPKRAADELEGALVRVTGLFNGQRIEVDELEYVREGGRGPALRAGPISAAQAMRARADARRTIQRFFAAQRFDEVTTPCWIPEPGTDVHLEPFSAAFAPDPRTSSERTLGYLRTSPEFSMKRLLSDGFEHIWQLGPA
ncbi:MAG: hypothetical protein AAGI01_16965, partial [Myxococcota bacterium]